MGFLLRPARRWVAGEARAAAIRVAKEAKPRGIEAVVNHLGEHYREKAPVEATVREYLQLLATMRTEGIRGEVSIKPTQFGVFIDKEYALSQMLPVLDASTADGRVLCLEMERSPTPE